MKKNVHYEVEHNDGYGLFRPALEDDGHVSWPIKHTLGSARMTARLAKKMYPKVATRIVKVTTTTERKVIK